MEKTFEERRLAAIKDRFYFSSKECACCKSKISLERVWSVWRYGINKSRHQWFYCKTCMPTAEDVLHEIDTDEIMFGIADVDDFDRFKKKDSTRMKNAFKPLPDPNGFKEI